MSTIAYALHSVYVICWGRDCVTNARCEECRGWSDEVLGAYVLHYVSLRVTALPMTAAPPPPAPPPPSSLAATAAPPPPDPLTSHIVTLYSSLRS